MFSGRNAQFDKLLEKATSALLLEPDWAATLAICDAIRQQDIQPKVAIASIRKRLNNENPHCAMYTLQVMESMAKNCGAPIHDEIATKETMDILKDMAKNRPEPVKGKVLELIQLWSQAFRSITKYRIVMDTFNSLKSEGCKFPSLRESDAMFSAEAAPEWKEGETCNRCRAQFGLIKRQGFKLKGLIKRQKSTPKHHCRNCGHTVCNDCSNKRSTIPRFGIEREVRVCDTCFDQINKTGVDSAGLPKEKSDELPAEYLASTLAKENQSADTPGSVPAADRQRELEMQEKEELELALALSASEAENQSKERARLQANQKTYGSGPTPSNQDNRGTLYSTLDTSEMDPELARYLNRNYWDSKASMGGGGGGGGGGGAPNAQPSAPDYVSMQSTVQPAVQLQQQMVQQTGGRGGMQEKKTENEELASEVEKQQKEFLQALKSSVEIFVNRMRSNSQRGRSIASDTAVQTLFLTLNAMHPQLLHYIKEQEDNRTYYESLQDKLAQLRDAREALNALRDENSERRRREQEERARIQHMQMMQKLEVMRQKKQEYLDYQRQLALQRMQEQDREMKQRLEQQKQMQQMRQYQQQYPYSGQQQQVPMVAGYQPPQQGSYQQSYQQVGGYQPGPQSMMMGYQGGHQQQPQQGGMSMPVSYGGGQMPPDQQMGGGQLQQNYGGQQSYSTMQQQGGMGPQSGYNQTYDMQGMNQALSAGPGVNDDPQNYYNNPSQQQAVGGGGAGGGGGSSSNYQMPNNVPQAMNLPHNMSQGVISSPQSDSSVQQQQSQQQQSTQQYNQNQQQQVVPPVQQQKSSDQLISFD